MRKIKGINTVQHYSLTIRAISKIPYVGFKIRRRYNIYRHQKIMKILDPLFKKAFQMTKQQSKKTTKRKDNSKDIIWFFWWQGKNKITDLSQKCYESLLKNKGNRRVIFISKDNFQEYIDIPSYILEKFKAGLITKTHFSDILRFNLLKKYGGLWVDATLYFSDSLNKFNTQNLLTCSGYSDDLKYNIAYGRWTGFFIGGPHELDIFLFMNIFFSEYWKEYNYLIDYYLIDYALYYAWKKDLSSFQEISKKNEGLQPRMFDLESKLGEKYNQKEWEQLTKNTSVFKLSNKIKIRKDKDTFFYKL